MSSECMPADIIKVDLGVISEAALVGGAAVGVLHAVGVECLDFPIVLCDDKLHQYLPLRRQQ